MHWDPCGRVAGQPPGQSPDRSKERGQARPGKPGAARPRPHGVRPDDRTIRFGQSRSVPQDVRPGRAECAPRPHPATRKGEQKVNTFRPCRTDGPYRPTKPESGNRPHLFRECSMRRNSSFPLSAGARCPGTPGTYARVRTESRGASEKFWGVGWRRAGGRARAWGCGRVASCGRGNGGRTAGVVSVGGLVPPARAARPRAISAPPAHPPAPPPAPLVRLRSVPSDLFSKSFAMGD